MKHKEIESIVESGAFKEEDIFSFIIKSKNSNLYMVTEYAVYLGKIQDGKIELGGASVPKPCFILEVRIFEEDKETKLTRTKEGFVWRKRTDKEKSKEHYKISVIDEEHKLWGKVTRVEKEWSTLEDQRGTKINIPNKYVEGASVGLIFRKYIDFQDWNLAINQPFCYKIIDERLVKYTDWREDEMNDK